MELNNAVLSLCNISMKRNNAVELDKVNLSFFPGVIHCVLGKYGSGKSSLVEIIRGKKTPHSGLIIYKDIYYSHLMTKKEIKTNKQTSHDEYFKKIFGKSNNTKSFIKKQVRLKIYVSDRTPQNNHLTATIK